MEKHHRVIRAVRVARDGPSAGPADLPSGPDNEFQRNMAQHSRRQHAEPPERFNKPLATGRFGEWFHCSNHIRNNQENRQILQTSGTRSPLADECESRC